MKTNRKHGFTIVELVVVIAIIAVLAAVLIPTFTSIVKKANDSAYLQERTNQQIADLAEKVENLNYFTWEDFEKKLAEELAKVGGTDPDAIQKAVDAAIAKYSDSSQTGNTGLTETQVKKIVEEAMKGQLTTAQVEAIVRQVLSGTTVSEETIRTIVNNAVKGMSTTGVTKAQVAEAVKAAISGTVAVNDAQLEAAVTKALEAFGVSTITDQEVEAIVSNLKNVITINEEPGFSTGVYTIASDKADKVYYLVTDAALESFKITGSTDATTIIIDAPNIKDVTIEGNAKVLRVLRTADESTHIKGNVKTLEVNSGRVVIEDGATVTDVKAAPAKQATVTIVLKSGSEVTNLNSEFQYYAGTNDYIKIIDEGATIENSFITSSSAVTTSTTTNVVLSGSAFVDTTTETATLKVKNESGVDAQIKVIDAENNETTYTTNGQSSNLTLFAGGSGTEADPYLIYDYATMQNISTLYEKGCYNFKVKDGVTTINCNETGNGWVSVKLCGNFDGNGVTFTNLNKPLFNTVVNSDGNADAFVTLKNFTINANIQSEGVTAALVYAIWDFDNNAQINIDRVDVKGYIEGGGGAASYIGYGSFAESQSVNFSNCVSSATIVAAGDSACGFVKHAGTNYCDKSNDLFTFTDCAFIGSLTGTTSSTNNYFMANTDAYATVTYTEEFFNKYNISSLYTSAPTTYGSQSHIKISSSSAFMQATARSVLNKEEINVSTLSLSYGDKFEIGKASANVDTVVVILQISPNEKNYNNTGKEGGSYTGSYMSETIDLTNHSDDTFTTNDIRYFEIEINGSTAVAKKTLGESGVSSDNKVYNVIRADGAKSHNGAIVKVVQYANGQIVKITNITIASSTTAQVNAGN